MIETTTHVVSNSEPCFGMSVREENGDFITRLAILRGDELQTCVIHHGPNEEYGGKIPPLFVPSTEGENPVGLMLEMSERHRADLRYYNMAMEMKGESTLINDVLEQDEKALLQIRNASTFGPHQSTQRNGHSHEKVVRDWFDKRAAITGKRKFLT